MTGRPAYQTQFYGISGELDVSPWAAMVLEVRRSSYRVAWIDLMLDESVRRLRLLREKERELEHEAAGDVLATLRARVIDADNELRAWLAESRKERIHLTNAAKKGIDAGLASRQVEAIQLEAETIAWILNTAVNAMGLDDATFELARVAMRDAIQVVSTDRQSRVIAGQALPPAAGLGR